MNQRSFNRHFNHVFYSVKDRLRRFDNAGACGRWNSTLFGNFSDDTEFVRNADELFAESVAHQSKGECVTSDGIAIASVTIDCGRSLKLHFRLWFLDAPSGCQDAPAEFSISVDPIHFDRFYATLSCGLHESDGGFWYPSNRQGSSVMLPDDYEWAYQCTRIYGPANISSWIETRDKRSRGP